MQTRGVRRATPVPLRHAACMEPLCVPSRGVLLCRLGDGRLPLGDRRPIPIPPRTRWAWWWCVHRNLCHRLISPVLLLSVARWDTRGTAPLDMLGASPSSWRAPTSTGCPPAPAYPHHLTTTRGFALDSYGHSNTLRHFHHGKTSERNHPFTCAALRTLLGHSTPCRTVPYGRFPRWPQHPHACTHKHLPHTPYPSPLSLSLSPPLSPAPTPPTRHPHRPHLDSPLLKTWPLPTFALHHSWWYHTTPFPCHRHLVAFL